jgi:hypothetical protein
MATAERSSGVVEKSNSRRFSVSSLLYQQCHHYVAAGA